MDANKPVGKCVGTRGHVTHVHESIVLTKLDRHEIVYNDNNLEVSRLDCRNCPSHIPDLRT